jgi:tetratricopeptide (TPR) repeat protein
MEKMKPDEVLALLKGAQVVDALKKSDEVTEKKEMASKLTDFASALNYLKGKNIICEAVLKKSLDLDPLNHLTHFNLGVLYSNPEILELNEKYVRFAIKHYLQCLEISPNYHLARYNLALLYFFTGEFEKSRIEYGKLLASIGDDRRFRELGMLFLERERKLKSQG